MNMTMKWLTFERGAFLTTLLAFITTGPLNARQTLPTDTIVRYDTIYIEKESTQATPLSTYEKKEARFRQLWSYLIPRNAIVQYAGNIGMFSFGAGWTYGKRRKWGTDVLFGFIPKFDSRCAKITMTLKENYEPWSIPLNKKGTLQLTPLSCGLFFNTVFGEDFWAYEPSRYPDSYYGFSTKIRANVYAGQQLTFQIPSAKLVHFKSITLYYELSACDIYLVSAFTNHYLRPRDYLTLGFGVRLNVFE